MHYYVDIVDVYGCRIARIDRVPLLQIECGDPRYGERITGLLPTDLRELGHGYRLRFYVDSTLQAEVPLEIVDPQWGDEQRWILRRLVEFHETVEVDGRRLYTEWNSNLHKAYVNTEVSEILRDAVSSVTGRLHYLVDHTQYPDGAQREYQKFQDRLGSLEELPVGGVSTGHYVAGARIDSSAAYAKDGDTIAGLVVDGVEWPDLRMMMIDTEEMSINSHTLKMHPEVGAWTQERYDRSGYKYKAESAKDALQSLIDTNGIAYIELNWHRGPDGAFDDRIDAYGRYIGLVYGGGECFNAAMIELGHSDVYLYADGAYLPAEMRLKEYFSYLRPCSDSVVATEVYLSAMDFENGIFGVLTLLAYAAGAVWRVDGAGTVHFARPDRPVSVWHYSVLRGATSFGSDSRRLVNFISCSSNPISGWFTRNYARDDSVAQYGTRWRALALFSLSVPADADQIVPRLLDDVAYPTPTGFLKDYTGDLPVLDVGELVEIRGSTVRRLDPELDNEWGGRFAHRHVFAVSRKTFLIRNDKVEITYRLTSPLRSVDDPIGFLVKNQPAAGSLYEFRLDAGNVGLDLNYHLD